MGGRERTRERAIQPTAPILSNLDLVVFALHRLGGATRKVYTEEIAWECYQIAPERFSWRLPQFRDRGFPDKDIVRVALTDAAKSKHGRLVRGRYGVEISGRVSDGWQLTPQGAKWIVQNHGRISDATAGKKSELAPKEAQRFSRQIRQDVSFQTYLRGGISSLTPYMFTDLLGCTPDAPLAIVLNKYERMLATAELVRDNEVIAFLKKCREQFPQYFSANNPGNSA